MPDKGKQILTIPNLLSVFRILLIPLIVWLYCGKQDYPLAAWVLVLSGATDIADGGAGLSADPVPGGMVAAGSAGGQGDRHGCHGAAGYPADGRGLQRLLARQAGHLRALRRHLYPHRLVQHSTVHLCSPGPGGSRQHPAQPGAVYQGGPGAAQRRAGVRPCRSVFFRAGRRFCRRFPAFFGFVKKYWVFVKNTLAIPKRMCYNIPDSAQDRTSGQCRGP